MADKDNEQMMPRRISAVLDDGLRHELRHWDYPGGRCTGDRPGRRGTLQLLGLRDEDGDLTPAGEAVMAVMDSVLYGEGFIVDREEPGR